MVQRLCRAEVQRRDAGDCSRAATAGCAASRPRPASCCGSSTAIPRSPYSSPAAGVIATTSLARPCSTMAKFTSPSARTQMPGPEVGHLWCIDIGKKPTNKDIDLSPRQRRLSIRNAAVNKDSGLVWHYGGPVLPNRRPDEVELIFGRTLSTVAIHDGLFTPPSWTATCIAWMRRPGTKYWDYDLKDGTWNSPYYVDGKVFLGTSGGDLCIFAHGKTAEGADEDRYACTNSNYPPWRSTAFSMSTTARTCTPLPRSKQRFFPLFPIWRSPCSHLLSVCPRSVASLACSWRTAQGPTRRR